MEDGNGEERDGARPILTGPAKAHLYPADESVFLARHEDDSRVAVASFQTDEPATESMAESVADACRIRTQDLTIIVAPTTSLVCAIQIAARPIDQIMHRLHEEGFDIHDVRYVTGRAPIPPLTLDEPAAMGRINDSLLDGGSVLLYVEAEDEAIERMMPLLPTNALSEYGKPFAQIFKEHDCGFFQDGPASPFLGAGTDQQFRFGSQFLSRQHQPAGPERVSFRRQLGPRSYTARWHNQGPVSTLT